MLRKELITQEEHDNLLPSVQVVGPAHDLLMPSDTILIEEDEVF
jgi:hypothetical protein